MLVDARARGGATAAASSADIVSAPEDATSSAPLPSSPDSADPTEPSVPLTESPRTDEPSPHAATISETATPHSPLNEVDTDRSVHERVMFSNARDSLRKGV